LRLDTADDALVCGSRPKGRSNAMRLIGVLVGVAALFVLSVLLGVAAPLTQQRLVPVWELGEFAEAPAPPTGLIYRLSHVAIGQMWLYLLIVVAVSVAMIIGVERQKVRTAFIWTFVGIAVALDVAAILTIKPVEGQARVHLLDLGAPAYQQVTTRPATRGGGPMVSGRTPTTAGSPPTATTRPAPPAS
jgi:hypothetical protein